MLMEETRTNMKNYRKEKDLTQEDLAKLMNVDEITIRRYENGHRPIPLDFIEAFAKLRGKRLGEIDIGRDERMDAFLGDVKTAFEKHYGFLVKANSWRV